MPVFDGRVIDLVMCLLVFWATAQSDPFQQRISIGTPLATLLCDWFLILSPLLWMKIRYLYWWTSRALVPLVKGGFQKIVWLLALCGFSSFFVQAHDWSQVAQKWGWFKSTLWAIILRIINSSFCGIP